MLSIPDCWRRFESNLPVGAELPTGASDESIRRAEEFLGTHFSENLRAFYQGHNGSGLVCFHPVEIGSSQHYIHSVEKATGSLDELIKMRHYCEADNKRPDHPLEIKHAWWCDRWLPHTSNGGGDGLFIDFDPDIKGSIEQVAHWWHEGAVTSLVARDVQLWFNEVVEKIDNGIYTLTIAPW